jgi:multiple sugar transport system substrate-binding protein
MNALSKMTRREFLRSSVLTAAAVAAVGCNVSPTLAPTTEPKSTAPTLPATALPPSGKSQVTLSFWSGIDPPVKKVYEELIIPQFEKENPDIKIQANLLAFPEYFEKVTVAFAGGIGPEVIGCGYGQLGSMIANGWVQPIDDVLKTWSDLDDINPVGIDSGKKGGKRYGLLLTDLRPFNYRRDHYKEAGLDPDKPPKNWTELEEYAKKLTKREGDRVVRAGIDIPIKNGEQTFASMAFTHGLKNLWNEDGSPAFDQPLGVETLEFLVKLVRELKVTVPSDIQSAAANAFVNGTAAQGFIQSQVYESVEQASPGNMGVALPPANPETRAFIGGTFIGFGAKVKNVEAAAKFVKFIYSPENMWALYSRAGFLPTRTSLAAKFAAARPYNATLTKVLENTTGWPFFPTFLQARQVLISHLEAIYLGQRSVKDGLAKAAEETKKLLQK